MEIVKLYNQTYTHLHIWKKTTYEYIRLYSIFYLLPSAHFFEIFFYESRATINRFEASVLSYS